mmetsp:Transcript_9726/g.14754  ORF Transcript_9726/g.14754 Transcript_9726/m.14754 type:complete len:226 (+) Transcript_9726:96-773(+)
MKINTVALLFALQASIASVFAIDSCDDDDIQTDDDCTEFCMNFAGGMEWSGHMKGPNTKITECSCTFEASEAQIRKGLNVYTCTREAPENPPVTINEDCEEWDIRTWPDCKDECSALADGTGYAAHHDGGMGNISACYCTYGENSFTCNRVPTPPPPIPQTRSVGCSESGISDQDTCFDFCLYYDRSPQYVSSANGLEKCRCRLGQGGQIDFECTKDSYLRSRFG